MPATAADDKQSTPALGAVFVSYARQDQAFVRRLCEALGQRGYETWVDWEGIPPSADWMEEVRAAITAAPAFVYVASGASARSEVCRLEVEHAASASKRVLPIALDDLDPGLLPAAVASRHWIDARTGAEFEPALEQLVKALDTDPEWAAMHTRLLVRGTEWAAHGEDPSFALRGNDLVEAEAWLSSDDDRKDPRPAQLHREYLLASRRQATRTQRIRTGVLAVGLVVAMVLAGYALTQKNAADDRAREARSRELAATALAQRSTNPELSLLLAVEAAAVERTAAAERAIRESLVDSYGRGTFSAHRDDVNDIALTPDGNAAITGSADGTARIWDLASGESLNTIDPSPGVVNGVAVSADGGSVLTATEKGAVQIWDFDSGDLTRVITRSGRAARRVAISADGRRIAVGTGRGATLWTADGIRVRKLPGLDVPTRAVAFSPDGRTLATGSADGSAGLWRAADGAPRRTIRVEPRGTEVNSVAFNSTGEAIVTASDGGAARVWGVKDGLLWTVLPASRDLLYDADFASGGALILTGSLDGRARVWDPGPLKPPSGSAPPRRGRLLATLNSPTGGVLSLDSGKSGLLVTAHSDDVARLWNTGASDVLGTLPHAADVLSGGFSPDARRILTGGADHSARLWDASTLRAAGQPLRHPKQVWTGEFSPDGKTFVTASEDGGTRIWDSRTGEPRRSVESGRAAYSASFSPDGASVAIAGDGGVAVWRPGGAAGSRPVRPSPGTAYDVAYAADGEQFASAGVDGVVRIFDADSLNSVRSLEGHSDVVNAVAFSPNGDLLASASEDRTVRIWDVESGETGWVLRGHVGGVLGVAFSPDGEEVATGSVDGTVRVWDAASGQLLETLTGPRERINGVSYSPDGTIVLAASSDRNAYLLRCRVCVPYVSALEIARARVQASLTDEERSQYLREAGIDP